MTSAYKAKIPEKAIDVIESGARARKGRKVFDLDNDLEFSTNALQSYVYAAWKPIIYDVMAVAAAIEFADMSTKRASRGWARRIELRIPVHDPARWSDQAVLTTLHDALCFLTGDFWTLEFTQRRNAVPPPIQECLQFPRATTAVLAYSDGMDSKAVAGIIGEELGDRLVLVRIGSKGIDTPRRKKQPFARIPYKFKKEVSRTETSARTRGFKFALISGLAASISGASEIVIPESGQGAIGPALITVTHAYPDYRNHPLFTIRMERFLNALFKRSVCFSFPRLWYTKGQTLSEFASLPSGDNWHKTKSCWRDSRWSHLNGKQTQCGVCAACMLRRMSVHAAGLSEEAETYICENLSAPSLAEAIHPEFTRRSTAFEHYAIAGTLHLDHMADMASKEERPTVRRHAILTGLALGQSAKETEESLVGMLEQHAVEWNNFMNSLGANSFIRKWTRAGL